MSNKMSALHKKVAEANRDAIVESVRRHDTQAKPVHISIILYKKIVSMLEVYMTQANECKKHTEWEVAGTIDQLNTEYLKL